MLQESRRSLNCGRHLSFGPALEVLIVLCGVPIGGYSGGPGGLLLHARG